MFYWRVDDGVNRGYSASEDPTPQSDIYTPISQEEYEAAIAAINPAEMEPEGEIEEEPTEQGGD